jgi:solute carrier family 25 phosphate transporter 23/24/25/41
MSADQTLLVEGSQSPPAVVMSSYTKNMLAGGVAGCIAKTFTAPLSRMTILYQVSSLLQKESSIFRINQTDSLLTAGRKLIKQNGFLSLWNGNLTSVIHRFPYSATNFAVFEASNKYLGKVTGEYDAPLNRFISGSLAGGVACFLCYPLDLVRTRLTVASGNKSASGSRIYNIMRDILRAEGVPGLYRGLFISLSVTAPTLAISFSVYGYIKRKLGTLGGIFAYSEGEAGSGAPKLSPVGSLISGCISGIISASTIYPIDVVRKRMQVMGQLSYEAEALASTAVTNSTPKVEHISMSTGTLNQFRHIMRTEGVPGFYRGLAPELLKVCPMVSVMYCSYEIVQKTLDEHFPSS